MDDRRNAERFFTCYPIHYQNEASEGGTRIALIHDLSVDGALLFTRKKLAVGDPVTLELDLKGDGKDFKLTTATVVRCERRPFERADVWGYDVGVKFDAPMPDLEPAIRQLQEEVKALKDDAPKKEGA